MKKYSFVIAALLFLMVALPLTYAEERAAPVSGSSKETAGDSGEGASIKMPGLFEEREVVVGGGEWALPGTLTIPAGKGPFPAVVFVHSLWFRDRDGTLGENRMFRDLAWELARGGIASLRYEKRRWVHAKKFDARKDSFTAKEDTIDDTLAAVSLLRQAEEIDPRKIFILGHGVGGMLAPRIGKRDRDIAGFIIMAGMSRPLEDVLLEQLIYVYSLAGELSETDKDQLEVFKIETVKVKDPELSPETPQSELPFELPAAYWLDLRGYNPSGAAADLKKPMLIMQGGRDYHVTKEDFEGWKRALSSRRDVQLVFYPSMSHLFISGDKKCVPKEYRANRTVDRSIGEDITRWIKGERKESPTPIKKGTSG